MPIPAIKVVRVNVERVVSAVLHDKRQVEDLRPIWEFVWEDFIVDQIKKVFETDGYGEWAQRLDNLPHPLLRKTYRLYRSYTQQRIRENINERDKQSYRFGTSVPYAIYHEQREGGGTVRPVVGLVLRELRQGGGARKLTEAFERYFSGGTRAGEGIFSLSSTRRRQLGRRLEQRSPRGSLSPAQAFIRRGGRF